MLNPRLKTRSDYHRLSASHSSKAAAARTVALGSQRWLRVGLYVMVGFFLGVLYTKTVSEQSCTTLALSSGNKLSKSQQTSRVVSVAPSSNKA